MAIVSLNDIKESMILASDVRDINGRFLCAQGTRIEPRHVRVFKMWGITAVEVTDNSAPGVADPLPEQPDVNGEAQNRARRMFCRSGVRHPAMRELFRLSARYGRAQPFPGASERLLEEEIVVVRDERIRRQCERLIQGDFELPEIPPIIYELNEVIADPVSSSDSIARVVSKSPALAARLLTIVNSPFYSFPRRVDSISRAVTLIGTREIATLAMGIGVLSLFRDIPESLFNPSSFLRHSFACGLISRILAAQKNLPQTEQLFVSGLLHDIGRLIFYRYFPDTSRKLLNDALRNGELLYRTEAELLGLTHVRVSEMLIQKWKLPVTLENNIVHHHRPSRANRVTPAAIVHVADIIVNALRLGSSGERLVPDLDIEAWEQLDLTPGCFEPAARQAAHQMRALESLFE